ncbi:MAG: hypothetical protein ACHQKY_11900, partial [Terriglobia bacterium]
MHRTSGPHPLRVRIAFMLLAMVCAARMVLSQPGNGVRLQVTVTDETGAFVHDLAASNFVVSVDKAKLAVR